MNETSSLTIFTRAALMLAEANTVQKAKELKDLAITAEEWAKRKNMGEDAILHCRSYALEAERKMGEMLQATQRAKGGNPKLPKLHIFPTSDGTLPVAKPTLSELGISKRESAEAQKLAALPAERFEALKNGYKTKKEALNPTHVSHNSGENEWYTPADVISAARLAMGGIDCDPASTKTANRAVKADRFFDKEQDGLQQQWSGNVWLNPPYSRPLITQFTNAVADKFNLGEIKQACVLVNNATETEWFGRLAELASAICFPSSRIKFIDMDGCPSGAPLQGQAIVYLGKRVTAFSKAFRSMGIICHVIH